MLQAWGLAQDHKVTRECASSKELETISLVSLPPSPLIMQAWGLAQDHKVIRECASKELEKIFPELTNGMVGLGCIMTTTMPFAYLTHLRSGRGRRADGGVLLTSVTVRMDILRTAGQGDGRRE